MGKHILIIIAQYQALNTQHRKIMEQPVDSRCRMCYEVEEHVTRIVEGCATLLPFEYSNKTK
jgi:hypothetical protein